MGAVISTREDPLLIMEYMDHGEQCYSCISHLLMHSFYLMSLFWFSTPEGSLYDLLHNETMVFEGETILPILRDIAQGLRFLHSAEPQIVHG